MNQHNPTSGDFLIRIAREEDIVALVGLLGDCIEGMRAQGIDQWDEVYPPRSTLLADIQSGTLYLASLQTQPVVASLVLNEQQDPEYSEVAWRIDAVRIAVVHRLMVHPANQHRGLARSLMRFAEQRALALGCRAIRLDAFSANPRALRLYRDLGYRDAGAVTFRKGIFRCFEKALELPQQAL